MTFFQCPNSATQKLYIFSVIFSCNRRWQRQQIFSHDILIFLKFYTLWTNCILFKGGYREEIFLISQRKWKSEILKCIKQNSEKVYVINTVVIVLLFYHSISKTFLWKYFQKDFHVCSVCSFCSFNQEKRQKFVSKKVVPQFVIHIAEKTIGLR